MRKVIKIKESKVLDVIAKIISEEAVGEIKVTASSDLGTHPEFKGLKSLLAQLKTNVQSALRGKIPYRVKTTAELGTVVPKKQGGALVLEVTLVPSEEANRHWFFDGAAAIYTYINTTSFSAVEGKVRTAAYEKATASFIGTQPQEAYPNHIGLSKFTGLNTLEPEKVYQLILKFYVGKRPGGFYDVGDDETETKQDANSSVTTNANTNTTADKKPETQAEKPQTISTGKEKAVPGDWLGEDIDEAHNVSKFLKDVQASLEEMWKNGKNPIVTDITMTVVKNADGGYSTKTNAKIAESTDGKAWVGIESRGSAGVGYKERADDQFNGGRYDNKGRPVLKGGKQINVGQSPTKKDGSPNLCYGKSLEQCMKEYVGAGDVRTIGPIEDTTIPFKQYFVNFTKPEKFPPR